MGTGTEVAMESAGVTLVKGDLRGIVRALRLSRATMRNIRQNLFFAFVYNALGVPVAILERKPWVEDATALLDAIAKGRAEGHIAGHTVTTVYYIVERERNRSVAATAINDLLQLLNVVPLGSADSQRALGLGLRDYEDGVQTAAGLRVGIDYQ